MRVLAVEHYQTVLDAVSDWLTGVQRCCWHPFVFWVLAVIRPVCCPKLQADGFKVGVGVVSVRSYTLFAFRHKPDFWLKVDWLAKLLAQCPECWCLAARLEAFCLQVPLVLKPETLSASGVIAHVGCEQGVQRLQPVAELAHGCGIEWVELDHG